MIKIQIILLAFIIVSSVQCMPEILKFNISMSAFDTNDYKIGNLYELTKESKDTIDFNLINPIINEISEIPLYDDMTNSQLIELDKQSGNLLIKTSSIKTWNQLCKSSKICTNQASCDQSGVCIIKYDLIALNLNMITLNVDQSEKSAATNQNIKASQILLEIRDENRAKPVFGTENQLMNVSVEKNAPMSSEITLIESTADLDSDSKLNRINNKFWLEQITDTSVYSNYCQKNINEIPHLPFSIRYDTEIEKLYLKIDSNLAADFDCYVFKVFVDDLSLSSPSGSSSAIVVVKITDTEDDRPIFEHAIYNFTITENEPIHTFIGQLNAKIKNLASRNQEISYHLVPVMLFDSFSFTTTLKPVDNSKANEITNDINQIPIEVSTSNGTIFSKALIDREAFLVSTYGESIIPSVSVSANSDFGLIKINIESRTLSFLHLYGYCQVNILIADVNDNRPQVHITPLSNFAAPAQNGFVAPELQADTTTNIYISENTQINQIVAYLSVFDPDAGENGTVRDINMKLVKVQRANLRTNANNMQLMPFRLNKIREKVYTLQLVAKLDFELIESYSIDLLVRDNGSPSLESHYRINLIVQDYNDHEPKFDKAKISVNITEKHYEGILVPKLNATDLDSGNNGVVRFSIVNNPWIGDAELLQKTLRLNSTSGELTLLRKLNRDEVDGDFLKIVVMAQDQGDEFKLNSTCEIEIFVEDLNDNQPKFDRDVYNVLVKGSREENSSQYMKIAEFSVSDLDSFRVNSEKFDEIRSNLSESQLLDIEKMFIYEDEICLKALKMSSDAQSDLFSFVIKSISGSDDSVKCQVELIINLDALNNTQFLTNDEFSFNLTVSDYGLANNTQQNASTSKFRVKIVESLPEILNELKFKTVKLQRNSENSNELATFFMQQNCKSPINAITSTEIASISKLRQELGSSNVISTEISKNLINITPKNKLTKCDLKSDAQILNEFSMKLNSELNREAYLINLIVSVNFNGTTENWQILKQVLLYENSSQHLDLFNNYMNQEQLSLKQYFNEKNLTSMKIQAMNQKIQDAIITSIFSNKTAVTQLIIIAVCSVFSIVALAICIVSLIVRHNNSKSEQKDKVFKEIKCYDKAEPNNGSGDIPDFRNKVRQYKEYSYCVKSNKTDVKVTDCIQMNDDESAQQIIHACKDKVHRYLDGLEDQAVADERYQKILLKSSATVRLSDADIKINKIELLNESHVVTKMLNIKNVIGPNPVVGSISASSNSSSTISDEGCYGSSDFSSEREMQLILNSKQASQQVISSPGSSTESEIKHISLVKLRQQASKCLNTQQRNSLLKNFSRFEKIYNNDCVNELELNKDLAMMSGSYV